MLAMPGFLMLDESPRWLVSQDRVDEARTNLAKAHAGGDPNSPLIAFEIAEIEATIKAEQEAKNSTSWADLWSTPGNRRRLFISISLGIFCQWVGNGVVSYYLVIVLVSLSHLLPLAHQTTNRPGLRRHHLRHPPDPHLRLPPALEPLLGLLGRGHGRPPGPPLPVPVFGELFHLLPGTLTNTM